MKWTELSRHYHECKSDNVRLTLSTDGRGIYCTMLLWVNGTIKYQNKFTGIDGNSLDDLKERAVAYANAWIQKEVSSRREELSMLKGIQTALKKMSNEEE